MSGKYRVGEDAIPHFVSFSVVYWIDALSRTNYKDIFLESLEYCIEHKGFVVHAWVIMPNHVHLIISSEGQQPGISDMLRDCKKYTSSKIIEVIADNPRESRNDAIASYTPSNTDADQNPQYRKNGTSYNYSGGTVQNWSNANNIDDRYATFTDSKTGKQTKFPGASITDFMVKDYAGYTTDNGSIHAHNSFELANLQNEYVHYIQAIIYGSTYYNLVIIPTSLYSAAVHPADHRYFCKRQY